MKKSGKIKRKTKRLNLKRSALEIYHGVSINWKESWKMYSGFLFVAIIFMALLAVMTMQEEEFTNLKARIKRLQDQKIELDNEKKRLLVEKVSLENPARIKKIAEEKMGLIEELNKKVVVVKVK